VRHRDGAEHSHPPHRSTRPRWAHWSLSKQRDHPCFYHGCLYCWLTMLSVTNYELFSSWISSYACLMSHLSYMALVLYDRWFPVMAHIIDKLSTVEFRLSHGVSERVQVGALVGAFIVARSMM
jgi:hypothetical protein